MAETKYLKALENLRDTYQRTSNVSYEGRGFCLLHLLFDFTVARNAFLELAQKDKLNFDEDRDVDYVYWVIKDNWNNEVLQKENAIIDRGKLWKGGWNSEDTENMFKDFMLKTEVNNDKIKAFYAKIAGWVPLNDDDMDVLEGVAKNLIESMCNILKSVKKDLAKLSSDMYINFGEQIHTQYTQGEFYTSVVDDFNEWRIDVGDTQITKNRYSSELCDELDKIYKSGFLEDCKLAMTKDEYKIVQTEKQFYDKNPDEYLKFKTLVSYDQKEHRYIEKYDKIGRYVYLHRYKMHKDGNMVEPFYASLIRINLILERMYPNEINQGIKELNHNEVREEIVKMIEKLDWDDLYKKEGCKDKVQKVFSRFLAETVDDKKYKDVPRVVWNAFGKVGLNDNDVYKKVSAKWFFIVLGAIDRLLSTDNRLTGELIWRKIYESQNMGLNKNSRGSHLSHGRTAIESIMTHEWGKLEKDFSDNMKWPKSEVSGDITENVYRYLKKLMDEVEEEVENENKKYKILKECSKR